MMRFIFMIFIGLVAVFAWRNRHSAPKQPSIKPQPKSADSPQVMISCAHCNINIPISEALVLISNGQTQHFCSQEHLRLHIAH
jgi:hypothetical protein